MHQRYPAEDEQRSHDQQRGTQEERLRSALPRQRAQAASAGGGPHDNGRRHDQAGQCIPQEPGPPCLPVRGTESGETSGTNERGEDGGHQHRT